MSRAVRQLQPEQRSAAANSRDYYRRRLYSAVKLLAALDVNPELVIYAIESDELASAMLANKVDTLHPLSDENLRRQKMFTAALATVEASKSAFTGPDVANASDPRVMAFMLSSIEHSRKVARAIDQRSRECLRTLFKRFPDLKRIFSQ